MADAKINKAIIAVNRFGLGAKGAELSDAKYDPQRWLLQQLVNPVFNSAFGDAKSAITVINEIKNFQRKSLKPTNKITNISSQIIKPYREHLLKNSLIHSVQTDAPLATRLMDFFSNHFSVSGATRRLKVLSPTLEREAIAPNLFGQFSDMLIAVEKHPAMLVYLNNEKSVGPNSVRGKKARGLNENLAREILELHTLGRGGGYTLDDITQLAMAISGWSVSGLNDDYQLGFIFRDKGHEPGTRTVLGKNYTGDAENQGEAVLKDLASHAKTANFISYKLAQHFIADEPPKALVASMTDTWMKTGGSIKAVVTTMIKHPQSWDTRSQKFKTPREYIVSALRAVNVSKSIDQNLLNISSRGLTLMGQKPFEAGSPAGYSQLNGDWTGSDALMKRIDWVNLMSKKIGQRPQAIASRIFDSTLSASTVKLIASAESRKQGLALLLLSPEFQRR
jgi:uncharacterized protein (DUF1800 family)